MPPTDPRFAARFDPDTWAADLERSTPAGRVAALAARREYERNGIPRSHLRLCEPEGRKTNLPDCAKVYVPNPRGQDCLFVVLRSRLRKSRHRVASGGGHTIERC